jgi:hypothetical protein
LVHSAEWQDRKRAGATLEVRRVFSHEPRDTMGEHGGYDVGVVDLPSADRRPLKQVEQSCGHGRVFLADSKKSFELPHPGCDRADWSRLQEDLRTRENSQEFPENLAADPNLAL